MVGLGEGAGGVAKMEREEIKKSEPKKVRRIVRNENNGKNGEDNLDFCVFFTVI